MSNSDFLPNNSVDCVIFGFENGTLNVLLVKMKGIEQWALPGGFIFRDEDLDHAAHRILKERTSLNEIFLRQFHVFGSRNRKNSEVIRILKETGVIDEEMVRFVDNRFISTGYYALVKQKKADISSDIYSSDVCWNDVNNMPNLMLDHNEMVIRALENLRFELNNQPVGMNLLPEKFSMTELQHLYEAILGKELDRRNFSRKMQRFGILKKLEERRLGVAHKSPQLYSFDPIPYERALNEGFLQQW